MYGDAELVLVMGGTLVALVAGLAMLGLRAFGEARAERAFRDRLDRSVATRNQSWYRSQAWQAREAAADADLAAGRRTGYASVEEFLSALDAHRAV